MSGYFFQQGITGWQLTRLDFRQISEGGGGRHHAFYDFGQLERIGNYSPLPSSESSLPYDFEHYGYVQNN